MVALKLDEIDAEISLFNGEFYCVVYGSNTRIEGNEELLTSAIYLEGDFRRIRYNNGTYSQIVGTHGGKNKITGPGEYERPPAA